MTTRSLARFGMAAGLAVSASFFLPSEPRAQRGSEKGAEVKEVKTTRQGGQTTVSISGEGAINRVQTWQDADGKFHVVFPNGKGALPGKLPGGVQAQRVGDSLELVVPAQKGANVTVRPGASGIDLLVSGGLDEGAQQEATAQEKAEAQGERAQRERAEERRAQDNSARRSAGSDAAAQKGEQPRHDGKPAQHPSEQGAGGQPQSNAGDQNLPASHFNPDVAFKTPGGAQPEAAAAASLDEVEGGWSLFSLTSLLLVACIAGLGAWLFVVRRKRASAGVPRQKVKAAPKQKAAESADELKPLEGFELPPFEPYKGDRRRRNVPVAQDRRRGVEEIGQRFSVANGGLTPEGEKLERRSEQKSALSANTPAVIFGAYRIDQEITKLVEGQSHSIEVLASRAPDDRRAIETSLIKALNSPETSEAGLRRVRQALEDYGFVARQSAALLLSTDTYERVSAAHTLGQVRSESSLPFLLEALYDGEPLVRTEAVASLGSLGLPKAIGALIDMARRYPEVPASLLTPALTACSFEAQEWSWVTTPDGRGALTDGGYDGRAIDADWPNGSAQVEQLPEWIEDENLADALERLESADVEMRVVAAQSLAQYPSRRSVDALTAILIRDESPAVRAAAVTSLGAIDHESVFAPVLYALADDAREVRAAAARAYSSVNFERADATARLIETADRETLEDLARACVKSGVAAQAINRLASEDRRHAYESFSLLSLVVKGGEIGVVVDTVATHRDTGVRLAAVRLATLTGDAQLMSSLKELAEGEGLPETVRAAISEAAEQGEHVRA